MTVTDQDNIQNEVQSILISRNIYCHTV